MNIAETPAHDTEWKSTPAGVAMRAVATILDWFILVFASMFLSFLPDAALQQDIILSLAGVGVLAYYIFFEGKFGATPGKMLLGLKVVKHNGGACDYKASTLRTVMRLIDVLPAFYLIAVISVCLSSRKQRLGDRVAGTLVVKGLWMKWKIGAK